MSAARPALWAAALLLALAGCERGKVGEQGPAAASAPAASAPASGAAASAAAAQASGPIIPPPQLAQAPTDAQRQTGGMLAVKGGANNVPACASCHGNEGEGNAAAGFPRIAGQSYAYLLKQLAAYADDSRQNPVMAPVAKAMTPGEREAAAAYYASLSPAGGAAAAPTAGASAPSRKALARGRQLAEVGDEALAVQACANCHGFEGRGEGLNYPYLAGQHAGYLVSTLGQWRDGNRRSDASNQMPLIARSLQDADVQAVAAYFAQLAPPPAPRDAAHAQAPAPAGAASAIVSGPHQGAQSKAPQGVGSEQGSATTGGQQGPGGGGGGSGAGSSGSPTGAPPTGR